MRRRLEIFIPIVVFSIMVQLLAPIGAFRAFAHAVSDPFYMATICSGMSSASDISHSTATPQHGANCCGFCSVSHGGAVAVDPPPLIVVALQRRYRLVAWLEATEDLLPARTVSHAQARAPPAFS